LQRAKDGVDESRSYEARLGYVRKHSDAACAANNRAIAGENGPYRHRRILASQHAGGTGVRGEVRRIRRLRLVPRSAPRGSLMAGAATPNCG